MIKRLLTSLSLITLLGLVSLALIPNAQAASYSDTQGHWAATAITKADSLGWVAGFEDGTFRPEGKVTRAEYISFLNRAFDITSDQGMVAVSGYQDVQVGAWYDEEIRIAEHAGYLTVFRQGDIEPNYPISRQEVAQLTANVLFKSQGINSETSSQSAFSDQDQIAESCRTGVAYLSENKLLAGYPDNTFRPDNAITRAEAIAILLRAHGEVSPHADLANLDLYQDADGKAYLIDKINGGIFDISQTLDGQVSLANGKDYLLQEDNSLAAGWQEKNGHLYYFAPYDYARLEGGPRSTGDGAYWFDDQGRLQTGQRPGGYDHKLINWVGPSDQELTNTWLIAEDADRRFISQAVANYAAEREGLPFKWFGTDLNDPSGVYCCGAVYSALLSQGISSLPPTSTDLEADQGYRMVKDQYLTAPQYGGQYISSDYRQMWPGDIGYSYYPAFNYGYNHAAIFIGYNGDQAMVAHATLADGFIVEPASIITDVWGYKLINSVRFV